MALTTPTNDLTGNTIASTYDQLLIIDHADGIVEATLGTVSTQIGKSALQLSDEHVLIHGVDNNNAAVFEVQDKDDTSILKIAADTPAATLTGTLTVSGITKVGTAAGSGADAFLYTAGAAAHVGIQWDADGDTDGTLIGGADNHGIDFKFYGETASKYIHWDQSADTLILPDSTPITLGTGSDATIQFDATNTVYNTAGYHSFTGGDVHVGNGQGLVVGHTAQETISIGDGSTDLVPEVQVLGTAQADSSLMLAAFSATATSAGAPLVALVKGGNASIGSHTIVTDGEELGNIIAYGDDGVDLESPAASIQFEVDGTPGAGDMPGRIIFNTSPDGGSVLTERMRITSDGYVVNEQGRQDHVANTMSQPYYRFKGSVDYIQLGQSVHLSPAKNISISMWINMEVLDSYRYFIASSSSSAGTDGYMLWWTSDILSFSINHWSTNRAQIAMPAATYQNKWVHIVGTYDAIAGEVKVYLNTIKGTDDSYSTDINYPGAYMPVIGALDVPVSYTPQGAIADVKIFNNTLTATEVKELYSGASVPYKYKGASQTVINNNLEHADWVEGNNTSTDNQADPDSGTDAVLLSVIAGGSEDNYFYAANQAVTIGKKYRYTVQLKAASGTPTISISLRDTGTAVQTTTAITLSTSWQTFSVERVAGTSGFDVFIGGWSTWSDAEGNIEAYDARVVQIGAVAEYDGSTAGVAKWYDNSGNGLDGTVSGATLENANAVGVQRIDDTSGAVTMPEQPAFLARASSDQNNIAIDTDVTVLYGTEVFDQGGDFASNTFTAPVTGRYLLSFGLRLQNIDSAASSYEAKIVTTNRYYAAFVLDPDFGQDNGYFPLGGTVLADMDASDTAYILVRQNGGTGQTDLGGGDTQTFFSGFLVC